ncbi:DUF3224 domain-containing protein [Streptomyces oceani]|uniref:DUF3224 domain-containing protein n=1 Tax=Streptomyces oceani TaxID=1075402 RepID=A0A1E7KIE2_9ACTN|nr:DUF3224 domain-containing protein [Streptomyces oceani]OEV03665.1 hypothetical protein AN216_10435 [Streptomyces oceani]
MPTRITGHFTYADWREHPVGPRESRETNPSLAHASVTNSFSGGLEAAETTCEYTIVYRTGTTGTFTGMQLLVGRLDGLAGSLVLEERGSFDEHGTVRCTFEVVAGTGTGELTGVRGSGSFTAQKGERSVPYAVEYELVDRD